MTEREKKFQTDKQGVVKQGRNTCRELGMLVRSSKQHLKTSNLINLCIKQTKFVGYGWYTYQNKPNMQVPLGMYLRGCLEAEGSMCTHDQLIHARLA